MPRFFFHLHNSVSVHDDVGMELPTVQAAKVEATEACRAIMADDVQSDGKITLSHHIEIESDDGKTKLVLPFRACVEILP